MGKWDQINSRLAFIFGSSPTIDESWLESGVGERLTNARSLLSDKVIPGNDGRVMSPKRALTAFTPLHVLVCQGVGEAYPVFTVGQNIC